MDDLDIKLAGFVFSAVDSRQHKARSFADEC